MAVNLGPLKNEYIWCDTCCQWTLKIPYAGMPNYHTCYDGRHAIIDANDKVLIGEPIECPKCGARMSCYGKSKGGLLHLENGYKCTKCDFDLLKQE
jgi:hypothetical protein